MQAGGNRARFFAPQAVKPLDVSSMANNSESLDGNSMLSTQETSSISSEPNNPNNLTYSGPGALVPFSKRNTSNDISRPSRSSSDTSENDTIAQRTRIIETELVFKTKREGHGRLNVSGLISHVDPKALEAEPQSACIKEVAEHEDIATRSPGPQSCSKLITKSIASRYPTPARHLAPSPPPSQNNSFDLPPSNQLASQTFHIPSHFASCPDLTAEDASTANQTSTAAQDDLVNAHISSSVSTRCDDSIKSLTTAFNRKHGGSRNPRYSSPVSQNRNARLHSPRVSSEGDSHIDFPVSHGGHGLRIESRNLSSIRNDLELQPSDCQGSQVSHGSASKHHETQESNAKGGLKRTNASSVGIDAPGGKRARMDTYDEFLSKHSIPSPMYDSPEVGQRETILFEEAASQGCQQITRQDPSIKLFSGQDLDDYVAIHVDRYEAAKKRWSECSSDEWERGADELADKLTSVLDFVKENMKRRVALYASLHSKIDQHQKERAETSEMLRNAKSKLVAKAGVVVDGGKS